MAAFMNTTLDASRSTAITAGFRRQDHIGAPGYLRSQHAWDARRLQYNSLPVLPRRLI
jgi:hypothetical protein